MSYLTVTTTQVLTDCKSIREYLMSHTSPTELKPPLILEVETENFVHIANTLRSVGYEVVCRAGNPSRFVVRDEAPQDLPPEAA